MYILKYIKPTFKTFDNNFLFLLSQILLFAMTKDLGRW
jgi:hypothetical protein